MADQPITGLPTKTASGVASTDKMLGIDSAEGYQILVQDVAKYIIENYGGSTLAGAARTPKAAIDLLNSKTYLLSGGTVIADNTDLNTLKLAGNYYAYNVVTIVNGPFKTFSGILKVENSAGVNDNYLRQMIVQYDSNNRYERVLNGTQWSDWELLPTRAEVNTLNSKFTGTTYANGKVFGNGKVSLYGNNEGGNIAWESPDGTQNEIDSYNSSSTRILAFKNDSTVRGQIIFPRDMTLNLSNVLAYPSYSDGVSLPELNGRPTSSNPFSKTAGSNGVISLFAYRTSTGNTLFIQLNNSSLYTIPAYTPMGCPVIIPVCKGDVLTLTTDTTSETWTIASAEFIPSKTS